MRPTADHRPFDALRRRAAVRARHGQGAARAQPAALGPACGPARRHADFVDGLVTMLANRDPADLEGRRGPPLSRDPSRWSGRVFVDADGELLIVPQQGALRIADRARPDRGRAGLDRAHPARRASSGSRSTATARGYVAENHGAAVPAARARPDRLQRPRQPARFRDAGRLVRGQRRARPRSIQKSLGSLWTTTLDHSPLDVVAWHGNYAPCRYDLARFNTIGTVSFDHPDPSIFTVLTSARATCPAAPMPIS